MVGSQKFPVPVRKQASGFPAGWYDPVINTSKKEYLNVCQACPGNISHHNPVCHCRDHTHLQLCKAGIQDFQILLPAYALFTQKIRKPLQHVRHKSIYLAVLLCQTVFPGFFKILLIAA